MSHNCKNCHQDFNGNFCHHCGQSADTHEINAHFLWHDIQHGLFHFDKGLFYTIKMLFLNPGKSIKAYINGQRAAYFKPISFLFFMATIYALLGHYLHDHQLVWMKTFDIDFYLNDAIGKLSQYWDWLEHHYAFYMILILPLLSLASFWAFWKQNLNYIQHLVAQAYLMGLELCIKIILMPIFVFFEWGNLFFYSILIGTFFRLWAFLHLFDGLTKRFLVLKISLMYLYLAVFFILSTLVWMAFALRETIYQILQTL